MAASLLPPNASPLERALEQSMAYHDDRRGERLDTVWRPHECPEAVLAFLAWGLGVRRWDPAWPEATRRRVVASAIALHRTRGTLGAVRAVLDEIGAVYDIEERPGEADFTMAVEVHNSNALLGDTDVSTIEQYIDDVKRFSVHYDLTLSARLDCSYAYLAGGVGGVQIADFAFEVDVT